MNRIGRADISSQAIYEVQWIVEKELYANSLRVGALHKTAVKRADNLYHVDGTVQRQVLHIQARLPSAMLASCTPSKDQAVIMHFHLPQVHLPCSWADEMMRLGQFPPPLALQFLVKVFKSLGQLRYGP